MANPKTKWKYGQLNAIQNSKFKTRVETNSNNSLLQSRESIRDTLYNTKLDLSGEFIGVVLKQLPNDRITDRISPLTRILNFFGGYADIPAQISVKVRVPEVHALIPEPEDISDDKAIALHDTFVATMSDVRGKLSWGTLVSVSFYDSAGVYNPKIIKVLLDGDNRGVMPETTPKAKEESQKSESLDVVPTKGDNIGSGAKENKQSSYEFVGPVQEFPTPANSSGKTIVEVLPSEIYKENRVRVHEGITSLPSDSSLLVNIVPRPSFPQSIAKIHTLVADRFNALRSAASLENIEIYCQSGWRNHAWDSREEYEETMVKRYGSVSEGEKWKAYISPHETGLAIDFYIPATNEGEVDIAPSQPGDKLYGSRTNNLQKKTKAFQWLQENAHKYGFAPFKKEAWHWEVLLPIEAWKTGAVVTKQYDISDFNIRVRETSIANGTKTSDRNFSFG